jgi:uncharacterized protein involved in copper resistance
VSAGIGHAGAGLAAVAGLCAVLGLGAVAAAPADAAGPAAAAPADAAGPAGAAPAVQASARSRVAACRHANTPANRASARTMRDAIACLVNQERRRFGLPRLRESVRLDRSAQGPQRRHDPA